MKRKKKKTGYLAGFLIFLLFACSLWGCQKNEKDEPAEESSDLQENVRQAVLYVYGDTLPQTEDVRIEYLSELTQMDYEKNKVLIVNDLKGDMNISKEEYEEIFRRIKDSDCAFFYLGEKDLSLLGDIGLVQHPEMLESEDRSAGYVHVGEKQLTVLGTISSDTETEDIPELIARELNYFENVDESQLELSETE